MERVTGIAQDELTVEVVIDGAKLIVIARKIENEGWLLSVLNEYGIFTNWIDYFATAQIAIDTGLKAIEQEGVDDFVDTNGFEYLFENNV
jgi:hypothetical protein